MLLKFSAHIFTISCLFACTTLADSESDISNTLSNTNFHTNTNFEKKFLLKVNMIRASAQKCGNQFYPAAQPLKLNKKLIQAAYLHSLDMSKHEFLDHVGSNGNTLADRSAKVNYSWHSIAENIAFNQRSIEEVLQSWLSSPGHCANLMAPDYQETGFAQVNWYWTQIFARSKTSNQ